MAERGTGVRAIVIYLGLLAALSTVFYRLILSAGSVGAHGGLYVLGLMWCPGAAGLAAQFLLRRSFRGMGWRLGPARYLGWSYAIPFLYALAAYGAVWTVGLGHFPNAAFTARLMEQYHQSEALSIAIHVGRSATLGMAIHCVAALGEEIGWRGFLVPHLAPVMSYPKLSVVSGLIWAAWHYPLLIFGDYNNGTPAWYGTSCFTAMVVAMSFLFAWMRLKSGSLWTGVLLHASHNLFVQWVFSPLTGDTGRTKYFIDEFGLALPVAAAAAAWICYRRRAEVEAGP